MEGFPNLKGSWPWPWIGSYFIPSCIPNFIEIEETYCGRTDVCTYVRMDIWDSLY